MSKWTAFSGQCPKCRSYNSRILTTFQAPSDNAASAVGQTETAGRVRHYICNECQHTWTETIELKR
jgi:hypothetical protein